MSCTTTRSFELGDGRNLQSIRDKLFNWFERHRQLPTHRTLMLKSCVCGRPWETTNYDEWAQNPYLVWRCDKGRLLWGYVAADKAAI